MLSTFSTYFDINVLLLINRRLIPLVCLRNPLGALKIVQSVRSLTITYASPAHGKAYFPVTKLTSFKIGDHSFRFRFLMIAVWVWQSLGLELTYNYGVENYEVGTGLTHIAVAVENPKAPSQLQSRCHSKHEGQPD